MGLILENAVLEVAFVLLFLFWLLYKNVTQRHNYWKERGVAHAPASFPFGSMTDVMLARMHFSEFYYKTYNLFKSERYFGIYETRKPVLVVKDPELIKRILTKDFHHFSARFVLPIEPKSDYISLHLFNISGPEWKRMRLKLTPTFTSGKMKTMFLLMAKCGEQLRDYVDVEIKNNPVVDVKDTLARFTMDIIASCAFGLEINSLADKNCEFHYYGMKVFDISNKRLLRRILFSALPFIANIYPIRFTTKELSDFFTRIIRDTVTYREKNNISRNDFLDLLIKIRNNKNIHEDEYTNGTVVNERSTASDKLGITIEEITAQSFIFFVAGFETASSTMTFCLFELARNPDIQERLYQEIREVLSRHGGKPTYQALQEMTYMDQVINETLRRYASLSTLDRTCTETYKVPDSDLVLEKGQKVVIPTYAIHHDPEHFPDPFKFDPERFSPEGIKGRHQYVHLPFGEGPRMCIGMRFGLLQTKIGLTEMVSNFEFGLTPDVQVPITLDRRQFITKPAKPLLLHTTKRMKD